MAITLLADGSVSTVRVGLVISVEFFEASTAISALDTFSIGMGFLWIGVGPTCGGRIDRGR